ncbi:MaoC family dehydratase [Sulfitobacter pseudonitzschiae]|uniref:MaoC family dehydratase n=1 Tax=Pseudosulfitobacter pseudonitzschiae TaxID=1402135 RepID=A0A9Q2NMU7_9RHOB|nr:MaoC family dehydratase [Pseudosulfitobacter pseudonitzschiae]MBM2291684.1 MaoC family dehydratase [Pseudosulfitobacter pseudonitzschiae]MBM2296602.1 MaoC family dehydratase [Pseudosulfitobacter pseudonitzschiae]MBM2301515.1 MaoC family dehydratase [Pseudosulfitobacter pseudonitzschiae]MBM2311299.1 MaoC family dehydratase [Pseudosulfitobacter pseudonitzschiae]MBM2316212.1 MaoC family dehydratase [Pseudosulfitobacter pseudonitzschiae]
MKKTNPGRFFEDYTLGQVIDHAVPRTVKMGERALYHMLYPARHALYSSDQFAQTCGLPFSPLDDMIAFHIVFGKTVPDVSLNAVANLGYAEGRWKMPVWPGDTLRARSEVIGLKQNSNGKTGVVYVRTTGLNQHDEEVLEYVRWVMVRKGNVDAPAPQTVVPELSNVVDPAALVIPKGLDFTNYDFTLAGEPHRWGDYEIGEQIDHVDGVTVEEAEHMMATRLWQNTAKVHFDTSARPEGSRLIYGGHVISMARALSFNGLANAQMVVGLNGGAHANPCLSGNTIRAWSEVLDKAETSAPGVGALRLRLVATKGGEPFQLRGEDGKYLPDVLLDLDYWALVPL